jgi:hypothetical protein
MKKRNTAGLYLAAAELMEAVAKHGAQSPRLYKAERSLRDAADAFADDRESADKKRIKVLTRALMFYASPDTYFGVGFFPDSPAGDIMNDFSETHAGAKPGKTARKAMGRSFEKLFLEHDVTFK